MPDKTVTRDSVHIEVFAEGAGPAMLLLPSLGRGVGDFSELVPQLAAKFRVIRPQPRGIGGSRGSLSRTTLIDWAGDVAAVIDELAPEGAFVIGHAFGNFLARCVGALWPDIVVGVGVVAGSPGRAPGRANVYRTDIQDSIMKSSDLSLSDVDRISHLQKAFFAADSDASVWLDGWWPEVKKAQYQAYFRTPVDCFFGAGTAPILQIQACEDAVAPMELASVLSNELGSRVTTIFIEKAGHALLPEQPDLVSHAILEWAASIANSRKPSEG
ncbi:alpha/beta hydrolase [Aminobacter sp. MSH1]|uniref:alpha/beta fold hydrolase n=1 Tax=Aminobacter sp. MSH1 TaxID=374606 RepID=UPI000D358656|nr:alpha/beta hydrolase [Aminobacter sp. MSH1]